MAFADPILKQLRDQALHFAWGAAAGGVAVGLGAHWLAGVPAAAVVVLPRELIEQWPISKHSDWWLDTLAFLLGGFAAGLLIRLL